MKSKILKLTILATISACVAGSGTKKLKVDENGRFKMV